jgi:c(7)-type cytochrome triheme protein
MATGLNCGDCHYSIFQKRTGDADSDGEMTMKALDEGKFCGTCHNGDNVFSTRANCDRCHVKKILGK